LGPDAGPISPGYRASQPPRYGGSDQAQGQVSLSVKYPHVGARA